jgi:DNA polymerase I-like protein with 3'-5' exonuclease and polymerase domains
MSKTIVFWICQPLADCEMLIRNTLLAFEVPPPHRIARFTGGLIQPTPDELVLAMGQPMIEAMAAAGIVPKKRTIDSLRGRIHRSADGGEYLLTFHPSARRVDSEKPQEIGWDIRLADRYARTGSLAPEIGHYRWVDDFSDLIQSIEQRYAATGRPVDVAGDSETLSLHPYDGAPIVAYGFTILAGFADCVYVKDITTEAHAKRLIGQTRWILTSPKVKMKGANFKYDMMWFGERLKIECTNFAFDTLLAGSLVNENRSNSLGWHAKLYTPLGGYDDAFNAKHDKARMDLVPRDDLLAYLGGDIDAVFRTADAIRQELLSVPALTNFYLTIRHPSALTFGRLERNGLLASRERFRALQVELEGPHGNGGLLAELDRKALALLPAKLRFKYADDLNINRPALLKDYFFTPMGLNLKPRIITPGKGEPSTARTHLAMFFDVPEAREMVQTLAHRRTAAKVLSTYVKGFLKHLRPDDRFHASYMLFVGTLFDDDDEVSGARTNRTSAKDPPIQTVPKHWKDKSGPNWPKKLRQCFPAPPGHVMWSTDAAQGELKIAACLAGEQTMIRAYRAGMDLHALTGSAMLDMTYDAFMELKETDPEQFDLGRFKAKASNFGMLYLVSAKGFVRYAWEQYRMVLTEAQAQAMIDKFFARYPGLTKWHERSRKAAHRDGYVMSPLGVVRHLPLIHSKEWQIASKAERQAVNSPVQSTLSNLTEWALVEIEKHVPEAPLCAMIHDSGMGYCPEDKVEELGKRIVEVASTLPIEQKFGWKPQLKFNFDFEYGPDMGSMTKMKVAANSVSTPSS